MKPQPTSATLWKPGRARYSAASTVTPAVRIPLISPPSMIATGKCVSGSFSTITALARGMPRSLGLSCLEPIHLIPAISSLPPTYPGIAMMRSAMWPSLAPAQIGLERLRRLALGVQRERGAQRLDVAPYRGPMAARTSRRLR